MLVIRTGQIDMFQNGSDSLLVKELMTFIVQNLYSVTLKFETGLYSISQINDQQIKNLVKYGVHRARKQGFEAERCIKFFVCLMFIAAPNFDEHPQFEVVMRNYEIASDYRLNAIFDCIEIEHWREVRQLYDVKVWNEALNG